MSDNEFAMTPFTFVAQAAANQAGRFHMRSLAGHARGHILEHLRQILPLALRDPAQLSARNPIPSF
jgi:hypothetical protein